MKLKILINLTLSFLLALSLNIKALGTSPSPYTSDGDVDVTYNNVTAPSVPPIFSQFGTQGANITDLFSFNNNLESVTLTQNNKIIAVGNTEYNSAGNTAMLIARYTNLWDVQDPSHSSETLTNDGILDPTIPGGTTPNGLAMPDGTNVIAIGLNSAAFDIVNTQTNTVVIGGYATANNDPNTPNFTIANIIPGDSSLGVEPGLNKNFNPNGELPGVVAEQLSPYGSQVNSLALITTIPSTNNELIEQIAAGGFASFKNTDTGQILDGLVLALYDTFGNRQWIFQLSPILNEAFHLGAIQKVVYDQAHQQIIALAYIEILSLSGTLSGGPFPTLLRFNLDGTLDTTFNPQSSFPVLTLQPGIVAFFVPATAWITMAIDNYSNIILSSTGIVQVSGIEYTPNYLIKINYLGSLDQTFGTINSNNYSIFPGIISYSIGTQNAILYNMSLIQNQRTDYRIVLSGKSFTFDPNITNSVVFRFTQDGIPDDNFNTNGKKSTLQTKQTTVNNQTEVAVANVTSEPNQLTTTLVSSNLTPIPFNYGVHVYEFQDSASGNHNNTKLTGSTIDHKGRIITVGTYFDNNTNKNADMLVMRYKSATVVGIDESQLTYPLLERSLANKGIIWPTPNAIINENSINVIGLAERDSEIEIRLDNKPYGKTISNKDGYWNLNINNLENKNYIISATDTATKHISRVPISIETANIGQAKTNTIVQETKERIKEVSFPRKATHMSKAQQANLTKFVQGLGTSNKMVHLQNLNIEAPRHKSIVNSSTPTITGTATPKANLTLSIRTKAKGQNIQSENIKANAKGQWKYKVQKPLADGNYNIGVVDQSKQTEGAIDMTVDTKISPPTIITNGSILSGQAEPNSIVTITINNRLANRVLAGLNGKWQYSMPIENPKGKYKIDVAITDQAGNTSTIVTKYT